MNEKSILAMTNSLFITRLCLDCKDQDWMIKSQSLIYLLAGLRSLIKRGLQVESEPCTSEKGR